LNRESFRTLTLSKKISVRVFALAGVLSLLIIQLNIYFAWTSHVGAAAARGSFSGGSSTPLRSFLVSEVNDFVRIQLGMPGLSSFFTNLARVSAPNGVGPVASTAPAPPALTVVGRGGFHGGGFFGGGGFPLGSPISLAMKYLIDIEVILFTLAVFAISLSLSQKKGIGVALLRAFEITSLTVLPLGLEIFLFDRFEFNVHASDIQALTGTAWFTNADVLYLSSAILGIALSVEAMRYVNRKSDNGRDQVTDFRHDLSSRSYQCGIELLRRVRILAYRLRSGRAWPLPSQDDSPYRETEERRARDCDALVLS